MQKKLDHVFQTKKAYIHVNDFRLETTTAQQLSMNKAIILSYQYLVKPPQKKNTEIEAGVQYLYWNAYKAWNMDGFQTKSMVILQKYLQQNQEKHQKRNPCNKWGRKTLPHHSFPPQEKAGEGCLPKPSNFLEQTCFCLFKFQ